MAQPKSLLRVIATGLVLAAAAVAAYQLYARYVEYPWTRDCEVRADVVLVAPRVAGWVKSVAVEDNQLVQKGDLLFEMDASSFELAVTAARVQLDQARQYVKSLEAAVVVQQAAVEQARTQIATAKGQIAAAQAQVESAKRTVEASKAGLVIAQSNIDSSVAKLSKDRSERDRAVRLAESGAGSAKRAESEVATVTSAEARLAADKAKKLQAEADLGRSEAALAQAEVGVTIARNGLATAEAALVTANANLGEAQANLGVAGDGNANVRAAQAALEQAELNLSWTRVVAPVTGYVTNVTLVEGHYAQVGSAAVALVDSSTIWVAAYFQETDLSRVDAGDPVVITLMTYPEQPFEGEVESIGWAIDPPDGSNSGTSGSTGVVPSIEPSFDWIRLAQRVPVRVRLGEVPDGVRLIAGTTASVTMRPKE